MFGWIIFNLCYQYKAPLAYYKTWEFHSHSKCYVTFRGKITEAVKKAMSSKEVKGLCPSSQWSSSCRRCTPHPHPMASCLRSLNTNHDWWWTLPWGTRLLQGRWPVEANASAHTSKFLLVIRDLVGQAWGSGFISDIMVNGYTTKKISKSWYLINLFTSLFPVQKVDVSQS